MFIRGTNGNKEGVIPWQQWKNTKDRYLFVKDPL